MDFISGRRFVRVQNTHTENFQMKQIADFNFLLLFVRTVCILHLCRLMFSFPKRRAQQSFGNRMRTSLQIVRTPERMYDFNLPSASTENKGNNTVI